MKLLGNKLRRGLVSSAVIGAAVLTLISLDACSGTKGGGPVDVTEYFLQAYLIRDMERDQSAHRVSLLVDGIPDPAAQITVDSALLPYFPAERIFKNEFDTIDSIPKGSRTLRITHGGDEALEQDLMMTDTFTANVVIPQNRIYTGGQQVQVGLISASVNAQGYIVAAVPAAEEYQGRGYAEFVSLINPTGNIPPSVFRDTLDPDVLLEGVWYVYMYAYTGAPQIDGIDTDLPTMLPDTGFTPNINLSGFTGSYGTIIVSKRDTLVVTEQN